MATKHPSKKRFLFTDASLKRLKPAAAAYDVRDTKHRGLTLRVSTTGRKTFRWTYRSHIDKNGKPVNKVMSLGEFGTGIGQVTLKEAVARLEHEKENRTELLGHGLEESNVTTVQQLAKLYFSDYLQGNSKRPMEAWQAIENDILPALGAIELRLLQSRPVLVGNVVKTVAKRAPVRAAKTLSIMKRMFSYAIGNGLMTSNPASQLGATFLGVKKHTQGTRWLTGEDIAALYTVIDADRLDHNMNQRIRIALKLLLLTGVRTGELIKAEWTDVDLDAGTWIIPVKNQKCRIDQEADREPFIIPLPWQAVELFRELETIAGGKSFVMSSRQSESGRLTDKIIGKATRMLFATVDSANRPKAPVLNIEKFTPHDLRRSLRTHLGVENLKIDPIVAEKCLNHRLGQIEGTYDKGKLLTDRREALQRFADYIDRVTGKADSNVRELHA